MRVKRWFEVHFFSKLEWFKTRFTRKKHRQMDIKNKGIFCLNSYYSILPSHHLTHPEKNSNFIIIIRIGISPDIITTTISIDKTHINCLWITGFEDSKLFLFEPPLAHEHEVVGCCGLLSLIFVGPDSESQGPKYR